MDDRHHHVPHLFDIVVSTRADAKATVAMFHDGGALQATQVATSARSLSIRFVRLCCCWHLLIIINDTDDLNNDLNVVVAWLEAAA